MPVLAQSQDRAINLELDLAASGSNLIDDEGLSLLRDEYGQALMNPWVLEAIQFGSRGHITVAYVD